MPSAGSSPVGKTRWKVVRSADILAIRREISSLGIERGFKEEAAPEPGTAIRDLEQGRGVGGGAHQAWGEYKQKRRVRQALGALTDLRWHWPGAVVDSAEGRCGTCGQAEEYWVCSPHRSPQADQSHSCATPTLPRGCVTGAHHADDVWVDRLNEDPPGAPHTLHQLVERCPLHLLPLQVGHTVQEVKHHPALGQLPAQQLMQLRGRHIWEGGRG